jgi:hypothetical protein
VRVQGDCIDAPAKTSLDNAGEKGISDGTQHAAALAMNLRQGVGPQAFGDLAGPALRGSLW